MLVLAVNGNATWLGSKISLQCQTCHILLPALCLHSQDAISGLKDFSYGIVSQLGVTSEEICLGGGQGYLESDLTREPNTQCKWNIYIYLLFMYIDYNDYIAVWTSPYERGGKHKSKFFRPKHSWGSGIFEWCHDVTNLRRQCPTKLIKSKNANVWGWNLWMHGVARGKSQIV